jgi:pimeloyl-ACP methyl ester carboxylesterase
MESDITSQVTRLEIPVYFISGKYDLTVHHDLSENYLLKLDAPLKRFYTFENSAHSPLFEEPERFLEIVTSDIRQENILNSDLNSNK